jgi:hypothetical protein
MELRAEESSKFFKKYIGSDEAQREPRREQRCYNCWETGHIATDCKQPSKRWAEREALRAQKGIVAPFGWEKMLAEGLEKDKRFAARFARLYEDPGSEDFGLQQLYSVESRLPDQTIAAAEKKGKGFRRDTVFPEPRERNRQRRKWTVEPYLESAKVPVPIIELAKVKSFRKDMRRMLFDDKDDSGNSSSEGDSPGPRSPAQPA